jgi:hypothetical protein
MRHSSRCADCRAASAGGTAQLATYLCHRRRDTLPRDGRSVHPVCDRRACDQCRSRGGDGVRIGRIFAGGILRRGVLLALLLIPVVSAASSTLAADAAPADDPVTAAGTAKADGPASAGAAPKGGQATAVVHAPMSGSGQAISTVSADGPAAVNVPPVDGPGRMISPAPAGARAGAPHVTFVSISSVYVSAGSQEGVAVGDHLRVVRGETAVAELEVTLTSPHKADCKRIGDAGEILAGDTVLLARTPSPSGGTASPLQAGGSTAAPSPTAPNQGPGDTPATQPAGGSDAVPPPATPPPPTPPAGVSPNFGLRGRVGVRYMDIRNRNEEPDYSQPSLDLRIDGSRVAGSDFDVNADLRARRTYRTFGDGTSQTEGKTRLYRLAAAWQRAGSPLRLTLGRQISPSLSVVSLFDGLMGEFRKERWATGAFLGTEPDPVNYAYSGDVRDAGAFYEYGSFAAPRRWAITTGAVSSREHGEINREFLFLQGRYDDSRFSGFATQEVDLNRGWRKEQEGSTWTATSTFASLRWRATETFALGGGIDTRRSVRLYRDFVSPETEFDDRYRRGAWISADGRAGKHFDYGVSYRHSDAGAGDSADSATVTLGFRRLTPWNLDLRTRSTRYTNPQLRGWLHSLSAGADLGSRSHLEVYGGARTEEVLNNWVPEERHAWVGLDWDLFLARHWMFTATAERNEGQEEDNDQIYATVSYRF